VDSGDLRRVQWTLRGIQDGAPKALRGAVNKTLTGVRTDMTKKAAEVLTLKQKRIRKDIEIAKKASLSDFSGIVSTTGRPVNYAEFKSTQLKSGLKVTVFKGERPRKIQGAFFAVIGGNKLAFWRKKDGEGSQKIGTKKRKSWMAYSALPWRYRFPIQSLVGPRVQDIIADPRVMEQVEESSRQRMNKELSRQVDKILARQRAK